MWSRLYWLAVGGPLAAGLVLMGADPGPLADARNGLFDLYQRAAPRPYDPDLPVRIVDVDEASLARIGQWPWPRATIAALLDRLAGLGAGAIAFDMVFSEPDRLDPVAVAALLPEEVRAPVVAALVGREGNDARFAGVLAASPSVLGAVLTDAQTGTKAGGAYPAKWGLASAGDDPLAFVPRFSGAVAPLPVLAEAAKGIGALNWLPDRDQVVRRVPLLLGLEGKLVPGLGAEALRVAQGASTYVVRASNASGDAGFGTRSGITAVKIGALDVPTDAMGEVRVRFSPTDPRRFLSAAAVLDGTVARDEVEGRIILVGTSAAGLMDTRATPLDAAVAGVEIQAQLIEHVITGAGLARPDWARGAEMVLTAVLGVLLALVLPRVSAVTAGLAGVLVLAALGAGAWFAFTRLDLLLDPMGPGAAVLGVYLLGVLALYRDEQQQKKWVRSVFGRFVSPKVVERLAENPERLVLGGETREITILFCDLRDFTSLSETMDAQALTRFMNAYLTPMTEVVLSHGGTIDKYIGDAIMAFWNAPMDDPHHARNAAACALAMSRRLDALNEDWRRAAEAAGRPYAPVRCGIGLATGPCCVGNLGSDQRLEYSCLGDDVNLASRIEGATKSMRVDILVSEATRDAAAGLAFIEADMLMLKGKSRASQLHLLAGDAAFAISDDFAALARDHAALMSAYGAGDFAAAGALAAALEHNCPPRLSRFYALYAERSREGREVPSASA
ncbi:adenylate/guanylate cyclase domain-containing protein [Xanthobacter dioxanivorans]|uniref:Adenylate/guanylate cyclase domain-containing protein n=1 Tax=Xanthobacter dioxanivorans TaxID=2528964 RepID=A0A974SL61_9HYPH|nr:adenylate/guanylate cyclase domain-containing protein [Xanthobacter dioxanivorans]QRG08213.1 adenylate/guanylate cyclase domain-containing protein [Xanthobacter dioxanivorans]